MNFKEKKDFLDFKVDQFNRPEFIETDPIQIPHQFEKKEDIEIAGFLVATIAWGNREIILRNGKKMMELMWNSPYDFVRNSTEKDLENLNGFVHRTFNAIDFKFFIKGLKHIYQNYGGLEKVFSKHSQENSTQYAIHQFKKKFFEIDHPKRSQKHVSDPLKNSAAKRINMFLRWMVRKDSKGVDFGRSEEHTSELQSRGHLVCRLLLEKKNQSD